MFGIPKAILDKCDQIKTSADSDTVEISYVLYTGKGEKVEMGKKIVKVSAIDAKIAELQGEKVVLETITKGDIDEKSI